MGASISSSSSQIMKRYGINRTEHPPVTEDDWSRAVVLADFHFPWEERMEPSTQFRALWDERLLFFRFDCVDDDLVVGSGPTPGERVLGSDRVEIFVTPDLSLQPYYCVEIAPNGDVLDYRAHFHRRFDREWQFEGLEVSASIEGNRYTVRGHLPIRTLMDLEVLRQGQREFYAGVFRGEFAHGADGSILPGWMAWVHPRTEKPDFHVPSSFGVFELLVD